MRKTFALVLVFELAMLTVMAVFEMCHFHDAVVRRFIFGICRSKLVRNKIKSGKKREMDELTAGVTGPMARGKGAYENNSEHFDSVCCERCHQSELLTLHGSGPTFIRPPKIQKEEDTRQVQVL
jgi:hypothetical protein